MGRRAHGEGLNGNKGCRAGLRGSVSRGSLGFELSSLTGQARVGDGEEGPRLASKMGRARHVDLECVMGRTLVSGGEKWGPRRLREGPRFPGPGFQ